MKDLLFPAKSRSFKGQRWANILLRTLHIVGVAGMAGGYLHDLPYAQWSGYFWLTLLSGAALILIALWSSAIWLCQVRGVVILAKLLLLGLIPFFPQAAGGIFILVILISGIVSHAPAKDRYYSVCHGETLDTKHKARTSAPR